MQQKYTSIIFVKNGIRKQITYLMAEKEALKKFKKDNGKCKILYLRETD